MFSRDSAGWVRFSGMGRISVELFYDLVLLPNRNIEIQSGWVDYVPRSILVSFYSFNSGVAVGL